MKCKNSVPHRFASFFESNILSHWLNWRFFSTNYRIDADENLVDSEYEEDDEIGEEEKNEPATRISWLLQIALENLGVTVTSYIVSHQHWQIEMIL